MALIVCACVCVGGGCGCVCVGVGVGVGVGVCAHVWQLPSNKSFIRVRVNECVQTIIFPVGGKS